MRLIFAFFLLIFLFLSSPSKIHAALPGDANNDNKVDGLDYIIWLNHFNQTISGVINGNFNNDPKVDGLDYIIWLNNFGRIATPAPTVIPTPVPTVNPTPIPTATPVGTNNRLTWSPPTLTNPITINLGTGYTSNTLQAGQDYIIKLPNSKKLGATTLVGGRNIVIIGGYISLPPRPISQGTQRSLYFKDQTGTVHVEGVLVDSSAGGEGDAIAISAPQAIVQVQNFRAVGLLGGFNTSIHDHSDIIQPWGGVKELRVDRLSGSSNYQGLFIPIDLGPITKADLRNVNLWYHTAAPNEGGYEVWFNKSCNTQYPINLSEVYVLPKTGRTLGKIVWPDVDNPTCPAVISNNQASWPSLPQIQGVVKGGSPSGGDFVPANKAGLNYVSPGYK